MFEAGLAAVEAIVSDVLQGKHTEEIVLSGLSRLRSRSSWTVGYVFSVALTE
jgi:hypothetical protein